MTRIATQPQAPATTSPAKVNALRALEEAAEAIGWSVSASSGDLALEAEDGTVYIDCYGGKVYVCTTAGMDTPVELVALLLEAAQATERPEGHRRGR